MPGTDTKGWGLINLENCCELNPKKGDDRRLSSGIKVSFIPMSAVGEHGEIDSREIRNYDEVRSGFTYFSENDVLFAKITPCMENGKGCVTKNLHNNIGFGSTEFHVLRPLSGISNPYWIYVLTSFKEFRKDAELHMTGSAGQRRTPVSFLANYQVTLPPIELQNKFASFIIQVDKSKFVLRNKLAVRNFYICLIDNCVVHRSVDLRMSQKFLHLLDRHPFINSPGRHCSAELVWVNFVYA